MTQLTTADKIAMYGGGGLVVLGVVAIGLLEMFLGATHPVDSEGAIVHDALVPMDVRAGIVLAGLLIWGLYAVYTVLATTPATAATETTGTRTAD